MSEKNVSRYESFSQIVKGLFFLLLVLQFAPTVFSNIKTLIEDALELKTKIGLLNINGMIYDSNFYTKKIDEFSKAPEIKGLLIKINSPGGFPGSSQAIFSELLKFKKKKPVVVVIENLCASAGYYIACASDKIICNSSSMVGSIGGWIGIPNVKELLNSWKIKFQYIQSGEYKTAGSPVKDLTEKEIKYFQNLSDVAYEQFVRDVATARKLDVKNQEKWADGKIFMGTQALSLKLVDQIGTFQDGISVIKTLAKIPGEIKLVTPAKASGFARLLGYADEDYGMESERSFADVIACFASDVYKKFLMYQAQPTVN
jgi:protease-4